jgi:N-acetylglucosaminyl-diphospho-decaprenol L-rhamnosyltransferase
MVSSVSATKPLTVDVAVVNWNTSEAACRSTDAFLASTGAKVDVTVVDNASETAERAKLEQLAPDGAHLILSDENLGFGAGANLALRGGSSEFICVSNADVIPDPDAIAILAGFCDSHPDCGMVGPAFAEQSAYHARLPSPGALALRPLIGGFGHRWVASPGPGDSIEVEQPAGACFVVRRSVWEQVGGFDEDYFLWYEDVDLAARLQEAGFHNFVCGSAVVHHEQGLSTKSMSPAEHQSLRLDGLSRYLSTHHPLTKAIAAPTLWLARLLRGRETAGRG